MKILYIDPDKHPVRMNLSGNPEAALKKLLKGELDIVYPFDEDEEVALVSSASAKKDDDRLNRCLRDPDGILFGLVTGPMVLCGATPDHKRLTRLSKRMREKYALRFYGREGFTKIKGRIIGVPLDGPINERGFRLADEEKARKVDRGPHWMVLRARDDPTVEELNDLEQRLFGGVDAVDKKKYGDFIIVRTWQELDALPGPKMADLIAKE